jgi:N-methylhydantoinase A
MAEEGRKVLEGSGLLSRDISYQRTADMRYVGQGHEVSVPLPGGTLEAKQLDRISEIFESTYRSLYGRKGPDVPLEVINWRVVARGPQPELNMQLHDDSSNRGDAIKGSRLAYFSERGYSETPIYDRYALKPGMTFAGPAIVEERESTLIIGTRGRARVDEKLQIVVELADDK